ncbi:MAG: inactive transglutaminase family protein, partial [Gammaproteobacteria bacterium]|nr:inactive transglutaminase family protein [Gammaproteobacteria bacterium]
MAGLHQRRPVFIISALLILTGLAIFLYKATRLDLPLAPAAQSDIWTVEARVSFRGNGGPVKATMHIPDSPPGFGILNENFVSRGFGLTTETENNNRQVVWAKRRVRGRQALYYRATVYQDASEEGARELLAFPAVPQLEEPFATALQELVVGTRERSADIVSFTSEMLRQLNSPVPDENVALFIQNRSGALEMARVAQTLLAGAKIPTRIVHGIHLRDATGVVSMTPWLEVQLGSRWEYFKPETGEHFSPGNYLTWYSGDDSLVSISNASDVETDVYVSREIVSSIAVAERRAAALGSHAIEFSLLALPIRTQSVYAVLLMIPLGALVMVIMRNIIGVPTFGTFTPILVALAFRETQLLYGVI